MKDYGWLLVSALAAVGCSSDPGDGQSSDQQSGPEFPAIQNQYGGAPGTGNAPPVIGGGGFPPVVSSGGAGTVPPPASGGSGVVGTGSVPAGAGGDGPVDPPPPPANTVTLTMKQFTIPPGAEVFMCQNYDNPFGGADAAVQKVVTDMAAGSHHLHIFYGTNNSASRELESCSGLEFHPLLHAAGMPHAETEYQAGMAAKVKGTTGLRLQVHYLNTTDQPLNVNVSAQLTTVDPSTVSKWIAELYFNRVRLEIPPQAQNFKVTTRCAVPAAYGQIGLIGGGSHMHSRGAHFIATTSTGVTLAETDDWAEPPAVAYEPNVLLNPGDSISWTCTYNNDTSNTLTFGESAQTNEMCIYLARFYSSPDGDDLQCQAFFDTGTAAPGRQ
jgi:hypothetical protein